MSFFISIQTLDEAKALYNFCKIYHLRKPYKFKYVSLFLYLTL
jgi:hypothetical protein